MVANLTLRNIWPLSVQKYNKRLHVFSYLNSRMVLLKHFLMHKQTNKQAHKDVEKYFKVLHETF